MANHNFIIHQYDEINRSMTWLTLSEDLAQWRESLTVLFARATRAMQSGPSADRRD